MKKIYVLVALLMSAFVIMADASAVVSPEPVLVTAPVENQVEPVKPVEQISPVEVVEEITNPTEPVWLNIPVSNVNAKIVPVGVTETNNLDVPPNYVEVGWYKHGPKPGDFGSAVLDGHVDNGASIDGVFKHLKNLKNGDEVYVTAKDGSKKRFIVTKINVYQTNQFPSNEIFYDQSGSLIKIITCHGTFIPSEKTYDQRLVVTAELVQ